MPERLLAWTCAVQLQVAGREHDGYQLHGELCGAAAGLLHLHTDSASGAAVPAELAEHTMPKRASGAQQAWLQCHGSSSPKHKYGCAAKAAQPGPQRTVVPELISVLALALPGSRTVGCVAANRPKQSRASAAGSAICQTPAAQKAGPEGLNLPLPDLSGVLLQVSALEVRV